MKRFLIFILALVIFVLSADALYYRVGLYIDFGTSKEVTANFVIKDGQICQRFEDGSYQPFEIKAVNLTSAEPGAWSSDFAVDEETYFRWLTQIQEMGANTVRVYTVLSEHFYNAFYKFNEGKENPLYLIQGATVDDYILNSRYDAYDDEFYETFYDHVKTAIEVIHGDKKIYSNAMKNVGSGEYLKDVSPWVIGYIWGVDWDDVTIAYANDKYKDTAGYNAYTGKYLYTGENATPFETMLTQVGDRALAYESKRYKEQRVFSFSNCAETDPFEYPRVVESMFQKCSFLDVENIRSTEKVLAGQFVSYNVQPYYPDYLRYFEDDDWEDLGIGDKSLYTKDGKTNTYKAYLQRLNNHHTMPVVISGIGFSSSRGVSRTEENTGRTLGGMTEKEQGESIVSCYEDAMSSGCVGTCISVWQDEWYKTSWNTIHGIDAERTPYWADAQTSEQSLGLLAFEMGKTESVCYVDGSIEEWSKKDVVQSYADDTSVSLKYDGKYLYFMVKKQGFDIDKDTLYIPIDTTQNSGSNYCDNYGLKFDRAADFVIAVNGKTGTRVLVQEYYECLRAKYSLQVYGFNTYLKGNIPDKDSAVFKNIQMLLRAGATASGGIGGIGQSATVYETGLLSYGNGNPNSKDYNSLADFMAGDGFVEMRIPWQMLNFYDPSNMEIHTDYYTHYGVVGMVIEKMYVGVSSSETGRIELGSVALEGWDTKVSYYERLKQSYFIVQEAWK